MAKQEHNQPPRGMRDFYPGDMTLQNRIFNAWKTASRAYGFIQYDASVVESLDLLKRKAGEEIVGQIYEFKDKSGRHLALRPEMTPTLARMISARRNALTFPLKWFSIAQCFRYERMTRGRKREHYQWNMDIIGEHDVMAEAEVLASAVHALELLGVAEDQYAVRFSSRALLSELFAKIGIEKQHHSAAFLALDKRGKIDDAKMIAELEQGGLDRRAIDQIFSILNISSLDDACNMLGDNPDSLTAVVDFKNSINAYGLNNILEFDISVVRGLAYYTGIVFEAYDRAGKFRAIFGGGRYDNLLGDIGGEPMTGVGLGFGDVVVKEFLTELGIAGNAPDDLPVIAIGYMQDEQRFNAIALSKAMRNEGQNVDLALNPEKAKNFFSRVGKGSYAKAVYIGPDDIEKGTARIKDLTTRTEEEIGL